MNSLRVRYARATHFYGNLAELGLDTASEFGAVYHRLQGGKWRETEDAAIATATNGRVRSLSQLTAAF
jgi:hypothetical protein